MSDARPIADDPRDAAYREAIARAERAEQALEAILGGGTDALVVPGEDGPRVFIREGADRQYRAIIELMAQGVAVCDAEGRVLQANQALVDLLGVERAAVVGRPIAALVEDESAAALAALIAAAESGQAAATSEVLTLRRPDGRRVPAIVNAGSLQLDDQDACLVTLTDLSQQKREDELVASERLARSIIEQAVDAIVVCDPDGLVRRASHEARRLCGGNPLLRRFDDAFPLRRLGDGDAGEGEGDEADDDGRPVGIDTVLGDEPLRSVEVVLDRGDCRRDVLLMSSGPVRDEEGRRLAQVVTLTDVTPLKEAEDRLREADRRKDEYLAMLAHELRNPLAAMAYGAALVRRDPAARPEVDAILDRQLLHMKRLVDDLLDVARLERGRITLQLATVDLAGLAEHAARVVAPIVAERRHRLDLRIDRRPAWARVDATRMEQVLVNLLNNAAKYTPDGGRIELGVGPDPRDPGRLALTVRDDGVGMTPAMLARVFDLFAQADESLDRQQGGLGIGLTLVRRLVDLHGGAVRAASDGPGTGSRFTVTLPAAPAPAGHDGDAPADDGPRPTGLVLVVDDNRDLARTLGALLRSEGHQIDLAHDGPEGIERASAIRPDAIVLDLGLPGLDGFEVARRLRDDPATADRLLIALSGYGRPVDRDRTREVGFDHHLTKPVDLDELSRLIASGLAARRTATAPAADRPATIAEPAPAPPAVDGRPAYRILLVEDQRALATIARRLLERGGHAVETAADGPAALDAARRFRPEVVFSDLMLDGPMDGLDLARALRADPELDGTLLIAVTARDEPSVADRCRDAGFALCLTKPIDYTDVRSYVAAADRSR